jgi:hypothetical protein
MIRTSACWLPGLFWLNDFTVPGAATSRGDGKNPATRRIIYPSLLYHLRLPAAVLLRSAIQKRQTEKAALRVNQTDDPKDAFVSSAVSSPE